MTRTGNLLINQSSGELEYCNVQGGLLQYMSNIAVDDSKQIFLYFCLAFGMNTPLFHLYHIYECLSGNADHNVSLRFCYIVAFTSQDFISSLVCIKKNSD